MSARREEWGAGLVFLVAFVLATSVGLASTLIFSRVSILAVYSAFASGTTIGLLAAVVAVVVDRHHAHQSRRIGE